MYHVPMCAVCGEYEVGTFEAYDEYYCSDLCADVAFEDAEEEYKEPVEVTEAMVDAAERAYDEVSARTGSHRAGLTAALRAARSSLIRSN